jgi:hypothetical protein
MLVAGALGCSDEGGPPDGGSGAGREALAAAAPAVGGRDLAIALALESASLPSARDALTGGARLFPRAWYDAIVAAYEGTAVGTALAEENVADDWRLVSLRLVPCEPMGTTPAHDLGRVCWPQVRLVWQPVLPGFSDDGIGSDDYADDRAVHALYDAPAASALGPAEAARADALRAKVAAYTDAWRGGAYEPLGPDELAEFVALRDRVAFGLLDAALALRSPGVPAAAYQGVGLRPEAGSSAEEKALRGRLLGLLSTYARPAALKALTSFSLPAGRQPAQLDEWVFLSFRGAGGALVREPVTFRSPDDGRVLFSFGASESASMGRDDAALYDAVDGDPALADAAAASVVLFNGDRARLAPVLRDRSSRLVPNTSCASCHKLNALRFDFHNFSYLEDRDLTVSPRVTTDVALDLAWAAQRGR